MMVESATNLNTAASEAARVVAYEERLRQELGWAMGEGGWFFEGKCKVQQALRGIARRLGAKVEIAPRE